jgi:hypothetical protein
MNNRLVEVALPKGMSLLFSEIQEPFMSHFILSSKATKSMSDIPSWVNNLKLEKQNRSTTLHLIHQR